MRALASLSWEQAVIPAKRRNEDRRSSRSNCLKINGEQENVNCPELMPWKSNYWLALGDVTLRIQADDGAHGVSGRPRR